MAAIRDDLKLDILSARLHRLNEFHRMAFKVDRLILVAMEDVIFDRLDEEQKKSRLADAYGIMNNGIKENAEANMKYSLVSFESDAVKEEYFKRAEEEKEAARAKARLEEYVKRTRQKQEEKDKFEADKKRVSQTGYYQVIKDEEAENGKYEGIYAGQGRRYSRLGRYRSYYGKKNDS